MNTLLEQIAKAASDDLRRLIEEGEDDIIKAIHKAEEEAQLQESSPKFALGFKISVDLDKSSFECSLGWTIKQTLTAVHSIKDPNQPELVDDTTITISTGDKEVIMTNEQFKKAAKAISKR